MRNKLRVAGIRRNPFIFFNKVTGQSSVVHPINSSDRLGVVNERIGTTYYAELKSYQLMEIL